MPLQRLKEFLDSNHVHYEILKHPATYTAQHTAESTHIPVKELAKTVIVKLDDRMAMVVLPTSSRVNLQSLQQATGAKSAELATEKEFENLFPGCEVGAMPPFGNLYDMEVFSSPQLAEDEEIAFNAGSHTELMRLAYRDFAELVSPTVMRVANSDNV